MPDDADRAVQRRLDVASARATPVRHGIPAHVVHVWFRSALDQVEVAAEDAGGGIDWGEPLSAEQARDFLEIVEDRYDAGSVLITSQVPVDRWYEMIAIPTLADAVLDRLIHNAYRIELSGDSLRKHRPADQPA